MAAPRHLEKAPITEAIVDFRVRARPDLDVEVFAQLKPELTERLPRVTELRSLEAEVKLGLQGPPESSVKHHGVVGFHFKSADGLDIAQFRLDGFTYNRLKPYTTWEQIFPTVLELWSRYISVAKPQMVTRLALRYINRIELPADLEDFEEVMTAPPPIPEGLLQHVSRFLTRVTIHDVEQNLAAHISQALESAGAGNKLTLLLDIDAYKERDSEVDSPEIPETFGALHVFKNQIFFKSLTEQAVERLQ